MTARNRAVVATCCGLAFLLALFVFHRPILRSMGNLLIESGKPAHADVILVLAGDWRGQRILKAGELVRAGYAPKALVSGPFSIYGVNEADLAIAFAVRNGYSQDLFEPAYSTALSTKDEAKQFAPRLRERGIRSILLVTSDSHTRRAAATFRKELGKDFRIHVVAARDKYFSPDTWWHHREGQKVVFYELSKTIANWMGM